MTSASEGNSVDPPASKAELEPSTHAQRVGHGGSILYESSSVTSRRSCFESVLDGSSVCVQAVVNKCDAVASGVKPPGHDLVGHCSQNQVADLSVTNCCTTTSMSVRVDDGPVRISDPASFSFEASEVGGRFKPQLNCNFQSGEMGSSSDSTAKVEEILRKYGIETRKYNPPIPTFPCGEPSQRPFTHCRSSSVIGYSSLRQMNLSQNNESLNSAVPAATAEANAAAPAPAVHAAGATPAASEAHEGTATPLKTVAPSSTATLTSTKGDMSRNNDFEVGAGGRGGIVQPAHGSSVDMTVSTAVGTDGPINGLTPAGSYSTLRNYVGSYGGVRIRSGGFSMASQSSFMDMSPFEGSYLKHHMSIPRYSAGMSEINSPSNSAAADALGASLYQERQRLRHIDHLITSGSGRTSRPYISGQGLASNSQGSGAMSPATPNSPSTSHNPTSYDSAADIATIQRTGSNVDTGQFNNNRINSSDATYPKQPLAMPNRSGGKTAQELGRKKMIINKNTSALKHTGQANVAPRYPNVTPRNAQRNLRRVTGTSFCGTTDGLSYACQQNLSSCASPTMGRTVKSSQAKSTAPKETARVNGKVTKGSAQTARGSTTTNQQPCKYQPYQIQRRQTCCQAEVTPDNLMAATALASKLIRKCQEQLDQHFPTQQLYLQQHQHRQRQNHLQQQQQQKQQEGCCGPRSLSKAKIKTKASQRAAPSLTRPVSAATAWSTTTEGPVSADIAEPRHITRPVSADTVWPRPTDRRAIRTASACIP